jgi:RNA-directed DNA polymerase
MIMSVFSFENIYRAYLDCRKNKRNRPDALLFEINAEENLHNLRLELLERSYYPSTSICFVTQKPKLREIFAADFRDRIVHHLVVRHLEQIWEPVFIYDSYASRKGKGIHSAVKRLRSFARKSSRNETRPVFYMQLDIKNFFMSIDKHILYDCIRSRCSDHDILWLVRTIIYHDPTKNYLLKSSGSLLKKIPRQKSLFGIKEEKGLPIGNLTSQFFANVYLNGLDQFIKHTLKCRFYMRYMDDLVLMYPEKEKLFDWKEKISNYIDEKLDLSLNHSRTRIQPLNNGIDFLGYIVRPGYVLCRNRVVNNLKARLRLFKQKLIRIQGSIEVIKYDYEVLEKLFACLNSYLAHFKHGNTFELARRVFEKNSYLRHYFHYKSGKLERLYSSPKHFNRLRAQYLYFQRRFYRSIIFFQVGCFYEFYGIQAIKALKYLGLARIRGKYNFTQRCGIGINAVNRYIDLAIQNRYPVVIINQTGYLLPHIAERKVHRQYIPILTTCNQ